MRLPFPLGMDSLLYDARAALRRLPKTPWFTVAVVATLAIATGANTLIFSVVDGVLLRPLPFGDPSRLVAVVNPTGHKEYGVSVPDFLDWRRQAQRAVLASYALGPATLTGRGAPERVNAAIVSANWFSLLGVTPGAGRLFTPSDDRPEAAHVIVVSDAFWRTRFGASALVGQTLTLDGQAFQVIGIAPSRFTYPSTPDIWLPDVLGPDDYAPDKRNLHFRRVIGRLAPSVTLSAAREEFATITDRIKHQYPQAEVDVDYTIEPLQTAIVGGARPALLVLFGAVGCLLLIACANVTNLLLVRATGRATEIALRIAIGAGRRRVVQELLVESVLLSLAGAALGVLLAINGLHLVVGTKLGGLPRLEDVTLSWRVLLFTVTVATLTGALFGLVPAYEATRVDLGETLKSATRGTSAHRRSGRTRGALVVAETAIAAVLLIGAVLLTRSLLHLMDVDPGFQPAQVVAFDVNFYSDKYANWARVREFTHAVKDRLLAIHGTRAAAYGFGVPFAGYPDFPVTFEIQGRPTSPQDQPAAIYEPISAGYFATMGVPITQGREFTDDDRSHGHRVLIINEACARKYFPAGDAIGHHLILGGKADTTGKGDFVQLGGDIVGVVGDMKFDDLRAPVLPEIFQPHEQVSRAFMTFVVRTTSDPAQVLAAAARAVSAVDPDVPIFHTRSLSADITASLSRPRLYAMVVMTFGVVALILAIVGIYGVLAYVVRERRRELGIRLALGAGASHIVRLVVGQGIRLVALGLALGLAVALIGSRVLASLLFGVQPNDLATYEVVCGVLLAVAALASWLPARSAASIDPLITMRAD